MTSYRPLTPGSLNKEVDVKSIESAIRAGGLLDPAVKALDTQYKNVMAFTLGAAGWHGPQDIQTLIGLEGTFFWGENPLAVNYITFTFAPDKIGSEGEYRITNGWSVVEEGIFHSVPNNPAIGWAFISLVPVQSQAARSFIVSGMFTDGDWKIINMLLSKIGESGPVLPPFSAIRLI